MRVQCEAGFTLIEVVVAVALIALAGGAAGTFFLGGATPVVASAARDLTAAFDEARRTASAFDTASLVIAPARAGSGYRARVYRGVPGDVLFAPQNGPAYESTVTIAETAAPLGAPVIAFAMDGRGDVSAYTNVFSGAARHACPATGSFVVHVSYQREARDVALPCAQPVSDTVVARFATPAPPAALPAPPDRSCPPAAVCVLPGLVPVRAAQCPPGTAFDATQPGLCDAVQPALAPVPTPTPCPPAFSGNAPACSGQIIEQYSAQADQGGPHTSTLFANGSLCDDGGCSIVAGAIDWTWGCAFAARPGTNGLDGANPAFQRYSPYVQSVQSMIAFAEHDAAQGSGPGSVATADSYCTGVPGLGP